jgi:hypothetical protein
MKEKRAAQMIEFMDAKIFRKFPSLNVSWVNARTGIAYLPQVQ